MQSGHCSRNLQCAVPSVCSLQVFKVRDDWKYVAMVIDRLLLLIFFGITLGGTMGKIVKNQRIYKISMFLIYFYKAL